MNIHMISNETHVTFEVAIKLFDSLTSFNYDENI